VKLVEWWKEKAAVNVDEEYLWAKKRASSWRRIIMAWRKAYRQSRQRVIAVAWQTGVAQARA